MLQKLKEALQECKEHCQTLEELNSAVNKDDPTTLKQWKADIVRWETDREHLNPYESKIDGMSLIVFGNVVN